MAYSLKARELRRCRALTKVGERCRAWACWDDPEGRCASHAGRTGGQRSRRWSRGPDVQHARYEPCNCAAYSWPHRPGGGFCRWPDEPEYRLTTPAGTRANR
jgi:hypothetical protein